MIVEHPNDVSITVPHFSVDNSLGSHIPEPLPRQAHFAAFIGPPRSGKTSLSTALLTQTDPRIYRAVFDHVHLIVPRPSFESMINSPFAGHSKVHHEFSAGLMASLMGQLEKRTRQEESTLIIIDDFAAELKDQTVRKALERFINNRRHLRLSVWIIAQTYRALPLSTRKLVTHLFMFRPNNTAELESVRTELVPLDRRLFEAYYQHVFSPGADPHTWLLVDTFSGELYNKFARLSVEQ